MSVQERYWSVVRIMFLSGLGITVRLASRFWTEFVENCFHFICCVFPSGKYNGRKGKGYGEGRNSMLIHPSLPPDTHAKP